MKRCLGVSALLVLAAYPGMLVHADYEYEDHLSGAIVIYASQIRHTYTEDTLSLEKRAINTEPGEVLVSDLPLGVRIVNSCGIESAEYDVKEVLSGYFEAKKLKLVVAHGETCGIYLHDVIKPQVLILQPRPDGLEYDLWYSGEIWNDSKLGPVLVTPSLMRELAQENPSLLRPLCCLDHKLVIDELREVDNEAFSDGYDKSDDALLALYGKGSVATASFNPLSFKQGVTLADFRSWLATRPKPKP
jgi:hypothetical protein